LISPWRSFDPNLTALILKNFYSVDALHTYVINASSHLCRQKWPTHSFFENNENFHQFFTDFFLDSENNFLNLFLLAKNVNCKLFGANPSVSI